MKRNLPILLLFLSIFLLLTLSDLVKLSMYNDGVWYAIISQNLANGIGSLWAPQLTTTIGTPFYEHPPMVFGIQSLFFRLFGESLMTERLFCLFNFAGAALLIVALWRNALTSQSQKVLWAVPLFFWMFNEVTYLYYASNMLESTMSLFTLAAILLFYKAVKSNRIQYLLIVLGALSVAIAFLCKGFVGLFPLGFFFLYYLIYHRQQWKSALRKTILTTGISLLIIAAFFGLLFWISPEAKAGLSAYIDTQVLASVKGQRTFYHHRESHFYIVWRLLQLLAPGIGLALILYLIFRLKNKLNFTPAHLRSALLFFTVGLSASLPIMVSPKQAIYYLLPAIPFFAIGIGLLLVNQLDNFTKNQSRRFHLIFSSLTALLFVVSLVLSLQQWGDIDRRDKGVLLDVLTFTNTIPEKTTVGSTKSAYTAHLIGYLYRFEQISLDTVPATRTKHDFFIAEKDSTYQGIKLKQDFEKLPENTMEYDLYKRKE